MTVLSYMKRVAACAVMSLCTVAAEAQTVQEAAGSTAETLATNTLRHSGSRQEMTADTAKATTDAAQTATPKAAGDTIATQKRIRVKRNWATWHPEAKRAMWLALVLPGAGQIYNRKYWKLPIVYGGFVGCYYAMKWNNQMYHDYSQAYIDIMDDDPNTQSYNQFLHLGNQITSANEERYKSLFKKRKDYYRRYRDLSFFCLVGVYVLSVIDAYVDASLSEFDISKDLSMKVSPQMITDKSAMASRNPVKSTAVGLQCSLNF